MLTPNGILQEVSYNYLHALTTRLGYALERTSIDMDSVDATICSRGKICGSNGKFLSPKIDVQLKATRNECLEGPIPFRISRKNYEDLRQNAMVPRILVALFLPPNRDWFDYDFDKILVYAKAYWMSLKEMGESENASNVTVYFPQSQRLTCESIQQMMVAAANREELAYVLC